MNNNPYLENKSIWDKIETVYWRFTGKVERFWRNIQYAWERAFKKFDRTISWSNQPMIDFNIRLLDDLIKFSHGRPMGLQDICPEQWQKVLDKWNPILGTNFTKDWEFEGHGVDGHFNGFPDEEKRNEYNEDAYNAWIDYLKYVRQFFLDAQDETCSQKNQYVADYEWTYTWKDIGNGLTEMVDIGTEEQKEKNKRYFDREHEIENFKYESLKKGLMEIAKNPAAFID